MPAPVANMAQPPSSPGLPIASKRLLASLGRVAGRVDSVAATSETMPKNASSTPLKISTTVSPKEPSRDIEIPSGKIIDLGHGGPPYVSEPDLESLPLALQVQALKRFYSENTFRCCFHNTIYKWLNQLASHNLKSLRSVRLSEQFSEPGFVWECLERFNVRAKDGLKPDVAKVPIEVPGEGEVWVGWDTVDRFEGLKGRWDAGDVRRKSLATLREERKASLKALFEDDEDE